MSKRDTSYLVIALVIALLCSVSCSQNRKEPTKAFHLRSREIVPNKQDCGIESLYICLRNAGVKNLDLTEMRANLKVQSNGLAASTLVNYAKSHHVVLSPVVADLKSIMNWNRPAILHVDSDHFIVFLGVEGNRVVVFDSGLGFYDATPQWFDRHYDWNGTTMILGKPPGWFQSIFGSLFMTLLLLGIMICSTINTVACFGKHRLPDQSL